MTIRSIALLLLAGALTAAPAPLTVVPSVDLARYAGKWYEIARLPAWFQRACQGDSTATYTLRPDGKITVLNECRQPNGRIKSARGTARLADAAGPNSKLRVSFFWPFYGDYWIIDLDPGYQWAVVGEPGRKYLWVLSRRPELDETTLNAILQRAARQGYDLAPLLRTKHTH